MEWKEVRLGDYIKILSGYAYKGKFLEDKGDNILLGMGCVSFKDKFLYKGARGYSEDAPERFSVVAGDLVLATRQQSDNLPILGMPAKIPNDLNAKQIIYGANLYKVDNKSDISNDYLFWQLKSSDYVDYIRSVQTGTTVRMITKANIEDYKFRCPDIKSRNKIVSILSSLDSKIETNNKINAKLEEMAQALFKSWFVDFEPFKDKGMVESELGMIPRGWRVMSFANFLTASSQKVGREGVPEFSVTNTGIHPRDAKFNKTLSKSSAKNKLLKKGNLVFGMSREILNWGVMKEPEGGVSSAYNIYIVDEENVDVTYLENFIKSHIDYFHDLIKPATREGQSLDKACLMQKFIYLPDKNILKDYLAKHNSIMNKIFSLSTESSRLSQLRDTLLPKLMSGEIEV